jgi:hypothetical protein
MKHRHNLPQLGGGLFLNDGGIETTLVFHEGLDLPLFAAFDLLKDDEGTETLRRYFEPYAELAREHGLSFDDSFSELNRVESGMNSGWVQIMGPASRVAQFKAIETTVGPTNDPFAPNGYFGLQQNRWPPTNIADTPAEALSRLFMLPGAFCSDPELSWKFERVSFGAFTIMVAPFGGRHGIGPA